MLVLTRKLQEQIRIGDNITITILRVKGRSVRVGIEAPRDVRLVRGELPVLPEGSDLPEVTEETTHFTVSGILDEEGLGDDESTARTERDVKGDAGLLSSRRGSLAALVSSVRQRQDADMVHTL